MAPGPVLFDLNGTLLDIATISRPWGSERGPLALRALDDAVMAGMTATLTGSYRPFAELLRAALERRARLEGLDASLVDDALELTRRMPPYPEVPGALDLLRAQGARLAVLSNSAVEYAEAALERAGLRDRFELVTGTDAVRAFKPDPRPYRHAVEQFGVAAEEVTMVAAHWWDVEGAKRAGLRTAWVARRERILRTTVPEPDVRGEDVRDVAAALVG
ncbi:MAG: haloacid dehalogenase type II [Actinomycetota bacterium]|nr:haloacid dehalogenase type II [Actinomycetota bacterium]